MLSIIIPIYNADKYIKECLKSILDEPLIENIEIILINDGSTDNSDKICRKLATESNKIKYVKKDNEGVSSARNLGISYAKGDYIMFVDVDDKLISGWFSSITRVISNSEKYDIYIFQSKVKPEKYTKLMLAYDILGMSNNLNSLSSPCSKIFKKKFLLDKNIHFESGIINGEDMLFNLQCVQHTDSIKIISESIYLYRQNPSSATHTFNKKLIQSDLLFHKKLSEKLSINEYKNVREYICNTKLYNAIFLIAQKTSYLKKFTSAKQYYQKLSEPPYSDAKLTNNISYKKRIIVKLIRKKKYFLVYLAFKINNTLFSKNIEKKDYFIKV